MDFDAAQGFDTGGAAVPLAPAPDTQAGDVSPFMDKQKPSGPDLNARDRDLVIRTVLGEAASQGETGQAAVAHVIRNRTMAGFADTPGQVTQQPYQFEPWMHQGNIVYTIKPDDPRYKQTGELVDKVFGGETDDPTKGATHFFAPVAQSALGRKDPSWAYTYKPTAVIGGHNFYQDPAYASTLNGNTGAPAGVTKDGIDQLTQALVQGDAPKGKRMDQTSPYGNGPVQGGIAALSPPPDRREFANALIQNALGKNDAPGRGTTLGKLGMLFAGMNENDNYTKANQAYLHQLGQALVGANGDPNKIAAISAMSGNPDYLKQALTNLGTPPQWGVIGKDMFGNDQHGWINPRTQTVTPMGGAPIGGAPQGGAQAPAGPSVPGAPAGAPGAPGAPGNAPDSGTIQTMQNPQAVQQLLNSDIKGDELLKKLDPTTREQVQALLDGREGVGNAARGTPRWQMLVALAHKADPTFDDSVFAARAAMRKNAMAGGTDYKTIQGANSVFHHLDQLSDAAEKIDNFSSVGPYGLGTKVTNEARTWGREQQSDSAISNFNYMRDLALKEVEKFYNANGGTAEERKQAAVQISAASTPKQLHEAIAQLGHAMTGKIDQIGSQWLETMGPKTPNLNVLKPAALETIQKLETRAARYKEKPNGEGNKPDAKAADAPKTVSTKAEYDALPSGAEYIDARTGDHKKKK